MSEIVVVGLGSGGEEQLTLGVWRRLQEAAQRQESVIVRTKTHPVVQYLENEGIRCESYDEVYGASATFHEAYERIVHDLILRARKLHENRAVLYAVPGHPSVAEATVQHLRQSCEDAGVALTIIGGESFLDQAFLRLGFDPVEGLLLLDAETIEAHDVNPRVHQVVTQIYDTYTAANVKLALLETYPPDHEVVLAFGLGIAGQEHIHRIPLVELDRQQSYGNHALLWVERSDDPYLRMRRFERLQEIVHILRSPEGCPWDREQTHSSIRKNLLEETYEVLETIDNDDPEAMCEELGDLLLQIMLHAQMEDEAGAFDVYDVIRGLNEKLIRRHPHVFGDALAGDASEALKRWDQVKAEEKRRKGVDVDARSLLDGIPPALPALMKALELQKRAAKVGFDWKRLEEVWDKVEEELREVKEAVNETIRQPNADERRREEIGDLLFAVANAARFLKIDPEEALAKANRKFSDRFAYIEMKLRESGKSFGDSNLNEMEAWWQEAKALER